MSEATLILSNYLALLTSFLTQCREAGLAGWAEYSLAVSGDRYLRPGSTRYSDFALAWAFMRREMRRDALLRCTTPFCAALDSDLTAELITAAVSSEFGSSSIASLAVATLERARDLIGLLIAVLWSRTRRLFLLGILT